MRRIALASSAMNQLNRAWRQSSASVHQAPFVRVLRTVNTSLLQETWTLLKSDADRLQAFHMRCLRRILGIRWYDHITNAEVKTRTHSEDLPTYADQAAATCAFLACVSNATRRTCPRRIALRAGGSLRQHSRCYLEASTWAPQGDLD